MCSELHLAQRNRSRNFAIAVVAMWQILVSHSLPKAVLVTLRVGCDKYTVHKQLKEESVCFHSQFQITISHGGEATTAAAWRPWSYCVY